MAYAKHFVAGAAADSLAYAGGPFCECHNAVAAGLDSVSGRKAVAFKGRTEAVAEHPEQDIGRVGRELELEEFLPHFLLLAVDVHDVAGHHALDGEEHTAEGQDFVDAGGGACCVASIIAQVHHAVAGGDFVIERVMQGGEAFGVAMNGRYGPYPARLADAGES